ncbi:hypothetical protein F3K40_37255, partial [Streptomyces sp. LBUM 1478]|nr:hypothetical protein [Streptomyces sp. LBUM 1478]
MSILASLRGPLRAVAVLATALACVVAVPHGAFAAPGDLDTTFGTGGKVSIPTPSSADGRDVAIQADGKIVSVGFEQDPVDQDAEFAVLRHHPDGSADTSFGGTGGGAGGEVLTDFEGGDDVARESPYSPTARSSWSAATRRPTTSSPAAAGSRWPATPPTAASTPPSAA